MRGSDQVRRGEREGKGGEQKGSVVVKGREWKGDDTYKGRETEREKEWEEKNIVRLEMKNTTKEKQRKF